MGDRLSGDLPGRDRRARVRLSRLERRTPRISQRSPGALREDLLIVEASDSGLSSPGDEQISWDFVDTKNGDAISVSAGVINVERRGIYAVSFYAEIAGASEVVLTEAQARLATFDGEFSSMAHPAIMGSGNYVFQTTISWTGLDTEGGGPVGYVAARGGTWGYWARMVVRQIGDLPTPPIDG